MRFGDKGREGPWDTRILAAKSSGTFLPRTRSSLRNLAAVKVLSARALRGLRSCLRLDLEGMALTRKTCRCPCQSRRVVGFSR